MSQLAFYLLGLPRLECDGHPVHVVRRRAFGVAIYLALTGHAVSRDHLAAFFWPELDSRTARTDLRRTLHTLSQSLGATWLYSEDDAVGFQPQASLWIDVQTFRQLLAACAEHGHPRDALCPACLPLLEQAVALYKDDFLAGFSLPDSPAFDDWQFFEGEQRRDELATALDRLAHGYTLQGDYAQALVHARRRLALDPLHEPAYRQLMQLYSWSGQPGAAFRQYEQCTQRLATELGVTPDPSTTELYTALKARRLPPVPQDLRFRTARQAPASTTTTPPTSEEEVRLVTVLSVGLYPAAHTDAATLAALAANGQALFTLVTTLNAQYGAQLTTLPGADLLVIFGATHTQEDDAEQTMRMALAIQAAAQAEGYRVQLGISSGAAYCHPPSTATATAVTVLGPLVRLATHLRNQAGVNQIVVDKTVYQQTRGLCHYAPITLPAVGATAALNAFQVQAARRQTTKVRGIEGLQAELIGRAPELAALARALHQAQQGTGQIVALVGDAGIGKSRLVEELKAHSGLALCTTAAEEDRLPSPLLWLEGRALTFAQGASYWLFTDLLRSYWELAGERQGPTAGAPVLTTLQRLRDAGQLQAEELEEIGPLLGHLLSVRFGNAWDQRLDQVAPAQLRGRMLLALRQLFLALARCRPLVLVFEDLQWADPLSLDLIATLLEPLAQQRLLLLCVYRPEGAQADARLATLARRHCADHFTELQLHELRPQQSRQLVASLLAIEALPATMRDAILAKAQGNPLFLEELVRVLIDSGQLYRVGATWQGFDAALTFTVPETLQGIILSRIDQLPPAARRLLQLAAVLGRLFQPAILAQMQPSADAGTALDVNALLQPLVEKNLIYQERTLPEVEYSFHHVLVRDAVYQALPLARRREFHQRAGAALEAYYAENLLPHVDALAYHYDEADVADKAINYLLQVGEKGRRAYLNQEAAAAFKRALTRLDALPSTAQTQQWRLTALTGLGRLYQVMADYEAAEGYLRAAIALGPQVGIAVNALVRLYYWLGDLLLNWQPRPAEARPLAEAGLALLGDNQQSTEAAMLDAVLAWSYHLFGDLPAFYAIGYRLATFLDKVPYAQELRPAYGVVATTLLENKEIDQALYWIDHARRTAAAQQDLHWLAESAYPFTRLFAGEELTTIMQAQAEALRLFRLTGDRKRINWNDLETGYVSLLYGALAQAQAALERSLPEASAINQENLASAHRLLGEVYHAQGHWADAIATFQASHAYYEHDGILPVEPLIALGYTELHAGRPAVAVEYFATALATMASPDYSLIYGHYATTTRAIFVNALVGLEEALADPAAFHTFCTTFRAARPALQSSWFTQWALESATPTPLGDANAVVTPLNEPWVAPWQWQDVIGNTTVERQAGLRINTPNLRDVWDSFLTAPRLLRPVAGDWVVQVVCRRPLPDRPAMGGILFWQDKWHFLRLDWGTRGQDEVALQGCVNRQEIVIGRGRLPGDAIDLRLERHGDQMQGFCSSDGGHWFRVGAVTFPVSGPTQVGLFTASYIERLIDPGAYPDGTAIEFVEWRMWGQHN